MLGSFFQQASLAEGIYKILGEMVNLQKVNLPKSQLAKKCLLAKNTNQSILVILSLG
jgi:hypothetical protein